MSELPRPLPEPPDDLAEYLKKLFGEIRRRATAILVKLALLEHKVSEYNRTIEEQNLR